MLSCVMKQLEERHVSHDVDLLLWSDRMDLLAIANTKGDVYLQRLKWKRVWLLPPTQQNVKVKGMAWRPDGKVICIGYSNGNVRLVDVENKGIVISLNIEDEVSFVSWHDVRNIETIIKDDSSDYLPDLSDLTWNSTTVNKNIFEKLVDEKNINILLIGTTTGILHISAFGVFTCAILNIPEMIGVPCSIKHVHICTNLKTLFAIVCITGTNEIKILTIDISVFVTHAFEIHNVAYKFGKLISLLTYLNITITSIQEAWESILLEMDSKLTKYASAVPEGTITADFLELLLFGTPSDEMEAFLLQDLTEKGLKKLGNSIESSYSNIQQLVLMHLSKVGQSLTYHLAELRGMSRLVHRYGVLGLREESVSKAVGCSGSFIVKATEVQQVIDHSMRNYKAFIRWLYAVILRLTDEQVPAEMNKMTQQDVTFISEFLQNFDSISKEHKKDGQTCYFSLERLGQYLDDSDLKIPVSTELNPWEAYLKQNETLLGDDLIIKHNRSSSLIQEYGNLTKTIESVFDEPKFEIKKVIKLKHVLNLLKVDYSDHVIDSVNFNDDLISIAILSQQAPSKGIYLIEMSSDDRNTSIQCGYFYFEPVQSEGLYPNIKCDSLNVIDVKFYTIDVLSVLLETENENRSTVFGQFPIRSARNLLTEVTIDCGDVLDDSRILRVNACSEGVHTMLRPLDDIVSCKFSVSGSRKVAVILADTRRKVHLFEMEADEEDEEEDGFLNASRDSDNMGEQILIDFVG